MRSRPVGLLVVQARALRRFWYPVARVDVLADGPVARRLLGVDLVVWSSAPGRVAAAYDRCPHRDARLSAGAVEECRLVCAYHNWAFGDDGRAVHIPQLGPGRPVPSRARLETYACAERYGWAWVALDEPVAPIPDVPEFGAEGWRAVHEPESWWRCSAPHLVDNNLDPAHIPIVHRASFGVSDRPEVPVAEVHRTATGLSSSYEVPVAEAPGLVGSTVRTTTTLVHAPFVVVVGIDYPNGVRHRIVKACTPVDDHTTHQLQVVLRTDTEDEVSAAAITDFDGRVWDEDRRVLETTWPDFQLDVEANVHLKIDRTSIEYRRLLAEVVDGRFPVH